MAQKFRPYLTAQELDEIILALKSSNGNRHLIYSLESFRDKIYLGITKPQITTAPTLAEKLELEPRLSSSAVTKDLATLKLHAYNKWLDNPAKCTIQELDRAMLYRFENDMLTPEEEASYIASMENQS